MKKQNVLWVLVSLLVLTIAFILFFRREPNIELQFHREVHSIHDENYLGKQLFDLESWKIFVFDLKSVSFVEGSSALVPGAKLKFFIEPPQKQWKRRELTVEITDADPNKSLSFKLISDSNGKLSSLFSSYTWKVSIQKLENHPRFKAQILGEGKAFTSSARSRFFGRLSERLLMNQLYLFDLIKLGTFDLQKESVKNNMAPAYQ